jgi:hypothetical protein
MLKPVEIKALPDYRIWVNYSDGVAGEVDLSHLVGKGVFALWNDYHTFEQVRIGPGRQISWTDEIDLCPDAIYLQITGKKPHELFPNLKTEVVSA